MSVFNALLIRHATSKMIPAGLHAHQDPLDADVLLLEGGPQLADVHVVKAAGCGAELDSSDEPGGRYLLGDPLGFRLGALRLLCMEDRGVGLGDGRPA